MSRCRALKAGTEVLCYEELFKGGGVELVFVVDNCNTNVDVRNFRHNFVMKLAGLLTDCVTN
eukprot:708137-Prorocentrum_minimum.AAC.2